MLRELKPPEPLKPPRHTRPLVLLGSLPDRRHQRRRRHRRRRLLTRRRLFEKLRPSSCRRAHGQRLQAVMGRRRRPRPPRLPRLQRLTWPRRPRPPRCLRRKRHPRGAAKQLRRDTHHQSCRSARARCCRRRRRPHSCCNPRRRPHGGCNLSEARRQHQSRRLHLAGATRHKLVRLLPVRRRPQQRTSWMRRWQSHRPERLHRPARCNART